MGSIKKLAVLAVAILGMLPTSAQESAKVVFFSAQQIENNIRKAPPNNMGESEINLIERTANQAGILLRRTKPGKAEVHETQADVWLVLDGGCTFVTGGTVIGGAPTEPGRAQKRQRVETEMPCDLGEVGQRGGADDGSHGSDRGSA